jgi:hypothetical protein
MRPDDLRDWLFRVPFQSFRMYLLEATSFEVHHPELVVVKRSTMDLYFSADHPQVPLADRQVTVALLHITRLEAMPPVSSSLSTGG